MCLVCSAIILLHEFSTQDIQELEILILQAINRLNIILKRFIGRTMWSTGNNLGIQRN